MALSPKAIHEISKVLTEDAISFIEKDERYADFMIEMMTEFVAQQLGTQDNELICELGCALMDNIYFRASKTL